MGKSIFFLRHEMLSVLIIIGLIFGTLSPVAAADYYKGQVITMLVSTSAGGGGDIWARLISNRLNDTKLLLGISPPELKLSPATLRRRAFENPKSLAERARAAHPNLEGTVSDNRVLWQPQREFQDRDGHLPPVAVRLLEKASPPRS